MPQLQAGKGVDNKVMPCLNYYPESPKEVHGTAGWLSDDSLLTIFSGLDLSSLCRVRQTCKRWQQLCGEFSPVWHEIQKEFLRNPYMDSSHTVDYNMTPLQRCRQTILSWMRCNPTAMPFGEARTLEILERHALWEATT